MNKITTALLGLLTLLCVSYRSTKQEQGNDSGYDFVASLFHPSETDTTSIFYTLKNPDGTVYCNIGYSDEEGFIDSVLYEKIFFYFPDSEIYAFFCKKPEEGKPIEVRVGNEWKILDRAPSIRIDSTSKYLQDYMFSPLGPQNEPFGIDFYPSPKADPAKKITLMQDSFGMKDFFVREIQGEWMKIQECINYGEWMKLQECINYGPLYAEDAIVDEGGWEKISKLSKKNPIYWIRWRKGDQILTPQTGFYFKYGC